MASRYPELEKYREQIYLCNECRCGFCRQKCPVYKELGYESVSFRGKMALAQALLSGVIEPTKRLAEIMFLCATCGWCKERCPNNAVVGKVNIDSTEIIAAFRADLVRYSDKYK